MECKEIKYKIRQAYPNDIRPALGLTYRVFMEFEAPDYEPEAVWNFKADKLGCQWKCSGLGLRQQCHYF